MNKKLLTYDQTVGGLKDLVNRIEKENIPDEARFDVRGWGVLEIVWSAQDGVSGTAPDR